MKSTYILVGYFTLIGLCLTMFLITVYRGGKKEIGLDCRDTLSEYIHISERYQKCTPKIYQSIIKHCNDNAPIKPEWILTLIYEESRFSRFAISHKGALGLCQLMPATALQLRVDDCFNPDENIRGGVEYLNYCLKRSGGDLRGAFMRYHAGPNRVQFPRGTRDYAERCMQRIKALP